MLHREDWVPAGRRLFPTQPGAEARDRYLSQPDWKPPGAGDDADGGDGEVPTKELGKHSTPFADRLGQSRGGRWRTECFF